MGFVAKWTEHRTVRLHYDDCRYSKASDPNDRWIPEAWRDADTLDEATNWAKRTKPDWKIVLCKFCEARHGRPELPL